MCPLIPTLIDTFLSSMAATITVFVLNRNHTAPKSRYLWIYVFSVITFLTASYAFGGYARSSILYSSFIFLHFVLYRRTPLKAVAKCFQYMVYVYVSEFFVYLLIKYFLLDHGVPEVFLWGPKTKNIYMFICSMTYLTVTILIGFLLIFLMKQFRFQKTDFSRLRACWNSPRIFWLKVLLMILSISYILGQLHFFYAYATSHNTPVMLRLLGLAVFILLGMMLSTAVLAFQKKNEARTLVQHLAETEVLMEHCAVVSNLFGKIHRSRHELKNGLMVLEAIAKNPDASTLKSHFDEHIWTDYEQINRMEQNIQQICRIKDIFTRAQLISILSDVSKEHDFTLYVGDWQLDSTVYGHMFSNALAQYIQSFFHISASNDFEFLRLVLTAAGTKVCIEAQCPEIQHSLLSSALATALPHISHEHLGSFHVNVLSMTADSQCAV